MEDKNLKNTKEKDWFDSPKIITYIITGLLIVLIILSQSFAIQNHLSAADILRSILNHNSIYVITLIYFILIQTKIGKKYFDYLNIIMSILLILTSFAGLFTVFQSFGLASLLGLSINVLMTIYFVYAFICHTEIGRELKIETSPVAEINNNQYFYLIASLLTIDLVVALSASTNFDSVVLSLLEMMYELLFARYIYLYKEYQDDKRLISDTKNKGEDKEEKSSKDVKKKKSVDKKKEEESN